MKITDCCGEDCPICEIIAICENNIKGLSLIELPSSEDENYKANTRKGVDVEYIPTAKSA